MAHLSLSFLGGFEVMLGAEPVTAFGTDRGRALLAFLAIESSRPHRRAELSAMLWPDLSEQKAAHNLRQTLLVLRKALRESKDSTVLPFLLITPQDVQFNFNSDCRLDVALFRELLNLSHHHQHPETTSCEVCVQWLHQAAELYRGNLLAGLFVPDSIAFEEWRLVQQEELHRQALDALRRLSVHYERRGHFEQVQEYARRQIALEPWSEEGHLQLMRALVQSGSTSAALRQYETYQRTLAEELGTNPPAAITSFYAQINAGEPIQKTNAQPGTGEAVWLSSQGERRQVTALVCSHGMEDDPEELQAQLSVCERYCEGIFNRFGGRRAVRQGEACLVYFGYPQAYEDAARRAVHSALAVAAALEGDKGVQIGIHTGVMTVGEKRGRRWQDRDLTGKTPVIARDCLRWAAPGQVIITAETQRLVQDSFDLQAIESQIPGIPGQPVEVYLVHTETGAQSRLEWLAQTQRLTALTGREDELAALRGSHKKVLQGKGQVIFLRGEPGIGKSRLLWELQKSVPVVGEPTDDAQKNLPPVLWLASRCLPHDQNTSLHPIIRLLEGLLGFQAVDSLEVRREKLVGMLAWHQLNQPSAVWLLSLLLGLPTEAPSPETITKAQREQMRQLYIALLQKRAAEQPVVLVIEDLHWSDPSTVEWIGHSLTSLASVPCLTLLTARPGFNPAWLVQRDSQRNLLILTILPLQPEQAEEMMFDLAGGSMLDEGVRRRVVAQTDGIPLFVEELTKTLLEQPALRGKGSKSTEIPATLMDSLAARLDHLGWAKETAQWAAVLGREFSYPILQACIPYDEGRLQSDLARLVEAELVSPLQIVPREMTSPHSRVSKMAAPAHYAFKHALMHEAAYVSLLKGTRQAYHRRIAEMLEARFPQLAEARPELLAQHYSNAGMQPQAVDLWLRACEHATALGATLEAKDFYDLALEALDAGDHERRWQALEGRERVFDLRVEREAQQHDITALRELAETSDNDTWRAQAWLRQMRYDLHCSDFLAACRAADAAIEIAGRVGNRALKAQALAGKVHALIDVEDRAAALQAAEETLAELREVADNTVQAYALSEVALYFHNVGDLSRAMLLMQRAMQAAQREGNRRRESTIHVNLGVIYIQLGLYLQARDTLEKGLVLAEAIGERGLPVPLTDNLGYVYWSRGDRDRAIALGEQALRENRNMGGSPYNEAGILAGLGLYLESAGEWAAAIEHFTEARAIFARLGMNAEGLEAQVVEARARLALGQPEEARQLASDAWKHLHKHGSAGIFYPARVYVCVADIVHAIEIPGLSVREVIEAGYHDLMQRAGKISDIEWRRSFVENVAENRAIVERWKAK